MDEYDIIEMLKNLRNQYVDKKFEQTLNDKLEPKKCDSDGWLLMGKIEVLAMLINNIEGRVEMDAMERNSVGN